MKVDEAAVSSPIRPDTQGVTADDFELFRPEHEELRTAVRAFVQKELLPHAEEWEKAEAFPKDVFPRIGGLGFFGMKYGEEYGGSGPDFLADAVVTEEFAGCGSGGVSACLGAHKDLSTLYVSNFGSDEQKQRWLAPALTGEIVGALAVTEPDTGSDVANIQTRARKDGGDWVISGTKTFITNGAWADFVVVAAKTQPDSGYEGITLFVVDADTPGYSAQKLRMLGWRSGQTGELSFSDVRIPETNCLGGEGNGFKAIMNNFAWERLIMALGAVAGAQRIYEISKQYALDRKAFGRPIGKFQVWRHRFADIATRLEAARAMTYNALRLYAAGENPIREVSMAKLYATELAFHVADECVQIHGGYGYTTEFPAERALRDARLGPIGGGTSEIMKEIIGGTYGL
ncbi:MAG TPA: acyl-CoA dehydrogenase family protein [Actinomycetota bacterium]|nr:acyl-CoA dehydrogenase family protein [Actinomycetota bacterium]